MKTLANEEVITRSDAGQVVLTNYRIRSND